MEGDLTLPAEDPRTHIDAVVSWALLEALDIALELHLLRLEVVARVILIAAGHGNNVQWRKGFKRLAALCTEGKHLQQCRLRLVGGVL